MRQRKRGVVRWREDIQKYIIDYYDNLGKRHKEAIGTNEHDAYRELAKKIEEIDAGSYDPLPKTETFKTFAERWLKGKMGIKGTTRVSYQGILDNHLIPYFGKGRISELRRKNLQEFVRSKADQGNLSSKSIENILRVLHQVLDDAQVEGLLIRNPYVKIEKPKRQKPEVDFLRTYEIPIFLKAAQSYKEPKKKVSKLSGRPEKKEKEKPKCGTTIHALFHTAIFSGMRRGELLGLKWGDIDWVSRKIHVRRSLYKGTFQTPKSEYSKRTIDMGPRLIEVLKNHRKKQNETRLKAGADWTGNDLVFCQNDGNILD
ncbi:MAG: site-specific integrase, partial [Deltaproteobacteria bacterium]|nr:site-specific integrase [Deltaproteobacteria bacterium]